MNAYDILGVAKDATEEQIKAAWRSKSLEAHPDREGGSDTAQSELNVARDILLDPERRAALDAGKSPTLNSLHTDAIMAITAWASVAADPDEADRSMIVLLREQLMNARVSTELPIADIKRDIEFMTARLAEVQQFPIDPEDNPLCALIETMIRNAKGQLDSIARTFEMLDEAERIINTYSPEPS